MAHRAELDRLIASYAEDWTIERMPVIDRNLLRLGTFELLYLDDVPAAVTINEAVELAKTFSTEDSGRFVNGILGRIASCRPSPNPRRPDLDGEAARPLCAEDESTLMDIG